MILLCSALTWAFGGRNDKGQASVLETSEFGPADEYDTQLLSILWISVLYHDNESILSVARSFLEAG